MPIEAYFPPGAKLGTVLLVFFISLILFHAVLVYWFKIGKIGWKIVDYVWVSMAALGLIGSVGQARQLMASNFARRFDQMAPLAYDQLRYTMERYKTGVGDACRTFVRGEWSPPKEDLERMQREYDAVCDWFKNVAERIVLEVPIKTIDPKTIPSAPSVAGKDLNRQIAEFQRDLAQHNEAAQERASLDKAAERSDIEWTWLILSPPLLAIAVALRLTKVTGEIRLDRQIPLTTKAPVAEMPVTTAVDKPPEEVVDQSGPPEAAPSETSAKPDQPPKE
jgi:hypothetical protein